MDLRPNMPSAKTCKVKDDLVNQLIALNGKLNTLSPGLLHNEQARAEVQEKRESLYIEIKLHRKKRARRKTVPRGSTLCQAVLNSDCCPEEADVPRASARKRQPAASNHTATVFVYEGFAGATATFVTVIVSPVMPCR